jgi:hypothetical protein
MAYLVAEQVASAELMAEQELGPQGSQTLPTLFITSPSFPVPLSATIIATA